MKILKNNLVNEINLRTEKDFPVKGIEFIDITPAIMNQNVFNEIIEKISEDVKKYKVEYILAPEARGFLLASAISIKLNIPCIPIRKKGKLPRSVVEAEIEYEKEYGKDILELPKLEKNQSYRNKKFYLVDDIYATGNTARAIKNKIEELGGNVLKTAVILNILELNNDKDIYSLIDVNEE